MKRENNEFLGLLCKLYMTALLVALPLYVGEGYWNLGNTKYMLFRNVSLLCLGLWLAAEIFVCTGAAVGRLTAQKGRGSLGRRTPLDRAVAAYGIITLLSAYLSDYGELAWAGYEGWFMGAVSQLLLVGTYFFVSRRYDGARWPLYLGETALVFVTLFGLLHRLGIDPLGLLVYWNSGDWEYSHMLSTLGNINWLCGYYSVALAFLTVHFLRARRIWLKVLLYVGTVGTFVLLGIQGSQGGWLILMVCVVCCLVLGRRNPGVRRRLYAVLAGFFLCMPVMELGMKLRGAKAAVVRDGNIFESVDWYVWVIAGGVCLGACALCGRWKLQKRQARLMKAVFLGGGAVCMAAGLLVFAGRGIDDGFGSGRGFLWRIALESFKAADGKEKLLGAGPDCYAEAVFNRLGAGSDVWKGEHWETAVFTNAHNEFLSQLCNVGILGTISYLAIFLTGLYQCWQGGCRLGGSPGRGRRAGDGTESAGEFSGDEDMLWVGLTAIAMYGAHGLISFQQVLNAPFFFLVLGIVNGRYSSGCGGLSGGPADREYEEETGEDYEVEEI
ncbi:MAG: O-antigen ligase family protein [Lachnospiraceae bacterium]|nr:O-antigen ligase family protein [Lachnospiraceae bacterium]